MFGALAVVVTSASSGWTCVAMASLDLSALVVKPGQEVRFAGSFYHDSAPVVLRWDSVDGPVLATVATQSLIDFGHGHWRSIEGRFTVPENASPGAHVIVATQHGAPTRPTWGVPARAAVAVEGPTPQAPRNPPGEAPPRLSDLRFARDGGGAAAPAAAVGLGGCALTVAAAGAASRLRGRRQRPSST